MPNNGWQLTFVSTALHFLVDGLCLCALMLLVPWTDASQVLGVLLTYNVMAFASQPLTGIMADKVRGLHWMLFASGVLFALSVMAISLLLTLWAWPPTWCVWAVAFTLGCGNSLFHVWGGKLVVLRQGNDMRPIGVFVSSGALGLSVGIAFCSWPLLFTFLLAFCLLSAVAVRTDMVLGRCMAGSVHRHGLMLRPLWVCGALLALVIVVMFRSYVGECFSSGIVKTPRTMLLLIGAVAMAGKMAGGWLACRLGIVRSMAFVIVAAVACFFFRQSGVAVLLLGLLMINCTMPVTLYLANVVLKGREGLAFGLLAAALLPGYLLAVM